MSMTDHTETLLRLSNACLEIDQCRKVLADQGDVDQGIKGRLYAAVLQINQAARELQAPNRRVSCRVVEIGGGTR